MNSESCDEFRTLLPAFADGELDLERALEVERHAQGCAKCGALLRQHRALSRAVRAAPYHRAPDELREKLGAQFGARPAIIPLQAAPAARPTRREWSRWAMPLAASLALAVGGNALLGSMQARGRFEEQLVASHVHSLQVAHLSDVVSTDQHTVKPWFTGKLDYAPPVRDLAGQDFPLTGGRLDYLAHRQVAALVYRHRQHVINLYVWPSTDVDAAPSVRVREGYSLVHWTRGGMEYWAVSDLNSEELRHFAELQIAAG